MSRNLVTVGAVHTHTDISCLNNFWGNSCKINVARKIVCIQNLIRDGLVIIDEKRGNEYVWIPVTPEQIYESDGRSLALTGNPVYNGNVVTTDRWENGSSITDVPGGTGYRGPDLMLEYNGSLYDGNTTYLSYAGFSSSGELANDLVTQFKNMTDSIEKYGGFFVGRYELGYENGMVCKPNVPALSAAGNPGTGITANTYGSPTTQTWYGLYRACKQLTNSSDSVTAGMIWSSQWDAMIAHIGDTRLSTAPGSAKLTGTYGDVAGNVYDVSTGLHDWTATAGSPNVHTPRGGNFSSTLSASFRLSMGPVSYVNYGTRPQLYIK